MVSSQPAFTRAACTSDGVPYRIRPLRPDDAARERTFINGLSATSRYQRFMHHLREAGDDLVAKLVNTDYPRTLALAAVVDDDGDERIVGVARYCADDAAACEFAVVVADDWQCRGVATTLVPLLFEQAARAGFSTIYGRILADNQRMIEFAEWLGLEIEAPVPGESTVRAWRRLGD